MALVAFSKLTGSSEDENEVERRLLERPNWENKRKRKFVGEVMMFGGERFGLGGKEDPFVEEGPLGEWWGCSLACLFGKTGRLLATSIESACPAQEERDQTNKRGLNLWVGFLVEPGLIY